MKRTTTTLLAAAVSGLFLGSTMGCASGAESSEAQVGLDKHACKGLNDCAGKGGCATADHDCAGKNSCAGQGGCATFEAHACKGMNDCKGQGGCTTADHDCAGKNECKGLGGCKIPRDG